MWDYAQLTKTAAEFGGPKDYIDAIETFAYTEGAVNGFKKGAGIVTLVALPVCAVIEKLYASYQLKKEDANKAKQALSSYMESSETTEAAQEEQND